MIGTAVDTLAVMTFLRDAAELSPAERKTIADKLDRMVARGERCKLGNDYVSLATMAEAAKRLRGGQQS